MEGAEGLSLGDLFLSLRLDPESFQSDLEQVQQIAELIPPIGIKPTVDHNPLKELNAHLDLKKQHFQEVQTYFDTNPLTPRVDLTEIRQARQELESLVSGGEASVQATATIKHEVTVVQNQATESSDKFVEAVNQLNKSLEETSKKRRGSGKRDDGDGIIGNFFEGVIGGAGEVFGSQIGKAMKKGLKKNFGFDAGDLTTKTVDKISAPVKLFVTNNPEFKAEIQKTTEMLGNRLRQVGYKLGDGIVAALEERQGTISDKLNAFAKGALDDGVLKKELKGLAEDVQSSTKRVGSAFANQRILSQVTAQPSDALSKYRETALQERAVPLVRERASEILAQKRTKNTANIVNENTKELFIATGGYAGARGLSGDRLAKDLKKQIGDQSQAIWVRNSDTDLPKESMSNAPDKLKALLTSLAKPNLRGYSKDAVEIASQAVAARERNPEIKIKIVGESGGGFAAEEAFKILKQMGIHDAEYIGVGTPEFAGALDKSGKKIISPDEMLGAETHGLYARVGLANTSGSAQNVLGVEGHPYENYKQAGVAELENFIQGPPKPLSKDEIGQVKQAAAIFRSQDLKGMSSQELSRLSKQAYANLQTIRRHLLVATDDTKKDLQEAADLFEQVFIETAPEPRDFGIVKTALQQAVKVYDRISQDRGLESGKTASIVQKELQQYQKEFSQKYGNAVGTVGKKYQAINNEIIGLIEKFGDPTLGVKQPPPKPPEPPAPSSDAPDRPPSSPSSEGGALQKQIVDESGKLAKRVQKAAGGVIRVVMQKTGEMAESAIVARVNSQLARTPGQRDVITLNPRQINKISEMKAGDYMHLARLGVGDVAGGMLKAGGVVQGVNKAILPKPVRSFLKYAVPTAGFGVLAQHPWGHAGAQMLQQGLTGGIHGLLSASGAAITGGAGMAAGGISNAVNSMIPAQIPQALQAAGGAMTHVPGMGQVAQMLTQSAQALQSAGQVLNQAGQSLLGQAAGAVAGAAGAAMTPLVGGRMIAAGGEQGLKLLAGRKDSEESTQIVTTTQAKVVQLQSAVNKAKGLLPAAPRAANAYIDTVKDVLPQINAQIDQTIAALPPAERMSTKEGAQLANLKSQTAKVENKLETLIKALKIMAANPGESVRRNMAGDDIIDVEAIDITPSRLPANQPPKITPPSSREVSKSISGLGESFKTQIGAAQNLPNSPDTPDFARDRLKIAKEVIAEAAEARQAIDALLAGFGGNVPKEVKDAAKIARQRITKSENKAKGITLEASNAGGDVAAGFNQGLKQSIDEVKRVAQLLAQAAIDATENKLEIKSPSRVFERIGRFVTQGFNKGVKEEKVATPQVNTDVSGVKASGVGSAIEGATKGIKGFIDNVKSAIEKIPVLGNSLKLLFSGFLLFQGANMIIPFFKSMAGEALKAAMNLDRMKTSLNYSSGGKAEQQLKFVEDTAAQFSTSLASGREGFKQLSSATKGTKVEGQATQELYQGISAAGSVLGMSLEQQERAFTAVSQIAQKGKAQAEEIRGQLSETGISFQLVADSMGVSTAELNKMLELGAVTAEDLLPKLGKKLRDEFGGAAEEASSTAMGAMARFQTASLKSRESFGKLIQPAQVAGLNLATTALQILGEHGEKVAQVFLLVGSVIAARFIGSILSAVAASIKLHGTFAGIELTAKGLKLALGGFINVAGLLVAQMALMNLAVETFTGIWDGFTPTDTGKKFEELADKGVANIERIRLAAENARNAVNGIPSKPQQKEAPSSGIDIGGALTFGAFSFKTDDIIKANNKMNGILNPILGLDKEFGNLATFGDIKQQQTVLQQDRVADVSRNLTGQFYSGQIDTEKGKVGIKQSFNQMKAIDDQVRTLQQQKQIAQAQPKEKIDKEKIKQIDTQIEAAQKQKNELNAPLQEYRNQLDSQIKGIKDAMSAAEASGDVQAQQQAQLDLTQLEKTKKAFDDMARAAQANLMPLSKMAQDFEKINAFLEEIDRLANKTFNQKQAEIAKEQNKDFATNRFSSVEAARKTASAEYDKSKLQYKGTKEALASAEYSLKDPALQAELATITTSTGKSITKDSSVSEIDDAKKRLTDKDSAKKDALDRLKRYKELQDQLIGQEATMRQNELKARQAMQAEYLAKFDDLVAEEQLKLKKIENKRSIDIAKRQLELIPEKITNVQSRAQLTMQRATFDITRDDADIKEAEIGRKDADLGVKEAQVQIEAAQNQMASAQEQAGLLQGQIDELTRANKEGTVSAEEFSRRKRDLEGQLSDNGVRQAQAQLQIGQARLANEEALGRVAEANAKLIEANNKKLINDLARQRKEMEALINVSVTRNVATNRSVMLESPDAREYSQAGADRYQLQIEAQGVQDRIDLKKLEREQNKWLVENKKRDAQEGAEIERQLAQEQTDLEAQLIDKRISMNQRLRDARDSAEKAMLDAAQARSDAEQKALAVGEAQIEQQRKRLDLAKQLLDTEASVVQSRSNLEITRGEGQLKRIGSQKALVSKMGEENLPTELKQAIALRLESQGLGKASDLMGAGGEANAQMALLKQQQATEDKIAAQRAKQLEADMKVEQASLEIQIQQNKLQAEGVVLQAESNRLQAEANKANQLYNVAQAQKNLNDAGFAKLQAVQDVQTASTPLEKQMAQQALQAATYQEMSAQAMMEAAQSGVDSADNQIAAAQMQAQSAQEQLGAQDHLANGMREALLNKQQAQVETFAADEFARKNGQFLEGVDLVNNQFQKLQKPVSDAARGMGDVAKAAKEMAGGGLEKVAPGVSQMKDQLGNTATLYSTKGEGTTKATTLSTKGASLAAPSVGALPTIAPPVAAPKVPNITPSIPEIKPPSIPGMQPKTPEMNANGQSGIDKLAQAIMNLADRTRTPNLTVNNFGSGADAVKLWEDVNKQKAEGKKL